MQSRALTSNSTDFSARSLKPAATLRAISAALQALEKATDASEVINIERMLESIEHAMRSTGLFKPEQVREANEGKIKARWKLGRLLAKIERKGGPGRGKKVSHDATSFRALLERLGLEKDTAIRSQRIATLPPPDLEKALAKYRGTDDYVTYDELITVARPYWYKANREARHRGIHSAAKGKLTLETPGPFPLIYADPPWKFEIYSPKGLARTPDQHYPTLTDEQIIDYKIGGRRIYDVAHDDAALLLWCTSSNLKRALDVMEAWDFEFKSSAVWVKAEAPFSGGRFGLGLVFRNMHEILLYGTRGKMPGPQYQPPSVFLYPRGKHSAKPPEVRREIEKMYPDFDERTRLELFSREKTKGWTSYGFEALDKVA